MAQTILIKRSTGSAAPATLAVGELAYSAGNHALHVGHAGGVKTWLLDQYSSDIATLQSEVGLNDADILALQNAIVDIVLTTDTSVATNTWVTTDVTLTGVTNNTVPTALSVKTFVEALDADNVKVTDSDVSTWSFVNTGALSASGTTVPTEDSVKTYVDLLDGDNVKTTDSSVETSAWVLDEDTLVSDSATQVPTQQSVKAYVDNQVASAVVGGMSYNGGYDATLNTPNITNGTGSLGETYTVTVAGTFLSEAVEVGDVIILEANGASTLADYTIVQRNTDHSVFSLIADEGAASGIATLDANTEVVQLPAGAATANSGSLLQADGTWTQIIDGGTFSSTPPS